MICFDLAVSIGLKPGILSCLYGNAVLPGEKAEFEDGKCLHLVSGIPGAGVFPREEMVLDFLSEENWCGIVRRGLMIRRL